MKKIILCLLLALPLTAAANDDSKVSKNANDMFPKCDANSDGKISKEEYTKEKMDKFAVFDSNHDNALSKEEHEKMAVAMHDMLMNGHEKKM